MKKFLFFFKYCLCAFTSAFAAEVNHAIRVGIEIRSIVAAEDRTHVSVVLTNESDAVLKLSATSLDNAIRAAKMRNADGSILIFQGTGNTVQPPPPKVDYRIVLPSRGTNSFQCKQSTLLIKDSNGVGKKLDPKDGTSLTYALERPVSAIFVTNGKPVMVSAHGQGKTDVQK